MASSDVSTVVNHFSTAAEGFVTTLGSTILSGATTVPLTSTSGLTNGKIFVGIIEPGTVGKEQTFTGVVDTGGNQITGVKWTRGSNTGHNAGVTIVDYISGTGHNMMTKGLLVEHNQDGTHGSAAAISILPYIYPVGSIYTNAAVSTNPATLLGFGTWTAFGAGRVMVGLDSGQTEFDTLEETGGAKTHTLTTGEIPSHTHDISPLYKNGTGESDGRISNDSTASGGVQTGGTGVTAGAGGGGAHNNLQPYIVVYMWKRTA